MAKSYSVKTRFIFPFVIQMFLCLSLSSQDGFSKLYPLSYSLSDLPQMIEYEKGEVLIGLSHLCIDEDNNLNFCGSIIKLSSEGDLIDSLVIKGFNVGNEDIVEFEGDSIYFLGYNTENGTINRKELEIVTSNTELSLFERRVIDFSSFGISNFFINGTRKVGDENWLYGNGEIIEKEGVLGLIFRLDDTFNNIIDFLVIEQCTLENHVFDLRKFDNNNVVFANYSFSGLDLDRKIIINKLNSSGQLIDSFISAEINVGSVKPKIALLDNQDVVFSLKENGFNNDKAIICLSGESLTEKWQLILTPTNSANYGKLNIESILPLANSDFLIIGSRRYFGDDENYSVGYISRISGEGDFVWEKNISGKINDEFHDGEFFNAIEVTGGEIIIAGQIYTGVKDNVATSTLWVVKLNSNGCIAEEDCGQNIYTSTKYNQLPANISLSPNPVNDLLSISAIWNKFNTVSVYDESGKLMLSTQFDPTLDYILDTSLLFKGVYFLKIDFLETGKENILKFIKIE